METPSDNLAIALDARAKGIVAIPCHPGTKVPKVRWKIWQTLMPPLQLQEEWFSEPCNIAIITTGMALFDAEDEERAVLVAAHCGDTPHRLRSPGGGQHLGYRLRKGCTLSNRVKIKGLPIDIKTNGGLEMIPNSETEKGRYEWLGPGLRPIAELPVARVGWTRTRVRRRVRAAVEECCEGSFLLYRVRRYIDTFARAVSGRNGHRTAFVAFLKIVSLVRRLGGGESEAWQLCLYYNATKCDPAWDLSIPADERALQHKFADALRLAK
jgi:hypothetical protein